MKGIVLAGNNKTKYEALDDCEFNFDICAEQAKAVLQKKGKKDEFIACVVQHFDEEVLTEIGVDCASKLKEYEFFGIRLIEGEKSKDVYPIAKVSKVINKDEIPDKDIATALKKVDSLSCAATKALLKRAAKLIEHYEEEISILEAEVKRLEAQLKVFRGKFEKCTEENAKLVAECAPGHKIVTDTITQVLPQIAPLIQHYIETQKEKIKSEAAQRAVALMSSSYAAQPQTIDLNEVLQNAPEIVTKLATALKQIKEALK